MTEVVLLTGGNLGPVAETLSRARQMLIERVGPEKICSGVWESEPWGFEAPQRFLNQVLVLETALEPLAVLDTVQEIERMLGRIREVVPNTITGPEIATSSAENSPAPVKRTASADCPTRFRVASSMRDTARIPPSHHRIECPGDAGPNRTGRQRLPLIELLVPPYHHRSRRPARFFHISPKIPLFLKSPCPLRPSISA